MSYELKIDPKKRAASRFIGKVRKALVMAAIDEKSASGVNQQKLASELGVNRSVITRMLKGESNLTLRSVAELAWALGWEPDFTMKRRAVPAISNGAPNAPARSKTSGTTTSNVAVYSKSSATEAHPVKYLEAAE